jgi:endonuclease/exonuclease/phosphatase family metal-dependent hydrolase
VKVVSFNIKFGQHVDSAIALLTSDTTLQDPDVLLLQEMDEPGTKLIAEALGMSYVYYPAMLRVNTKRDFGNAVLSRWPILSDSKIILPHLARLHGGQRIATAVTLAIREQPVRVYSVHLGTIVNVSGGSRRDQLRTVLTDAANYQHVIVGGDMNNKGIGNLAREMGFAWPTEQGPKTVLLGRWDHIFLKGLLIPPVGVSGTVRNNYHASDHRAVWVRAILP